ncbi:MAG: NifU family protein [Candidatus Eisenbacteria bacterium]|uniref:NifU family protein n=1 Tax=Eiseniibacteriota bacterium TaxID=2212470 RepID=A0A948W852_UNCEI|nr:NifU family protein [Candidatus Eisenbacteria bacterium]MBU1948655.1 NifU family protein [Candidatus Eisenbacteria bacterium]MBU2693309.1 NifU family protein [Candidatus Eisenbacteria bacterium]
MKQENKIMAQPLDQETCVFTTTEPVFENHSFYFSDHTKAQGSPLVEKIFEVEGIKAVLVAHDKITITTEGTSDWYPVAMQVGGKIREAVQSDETLVSSTVLEGMPPEEEIRHKVMELFEGEINPTLAAHGGSVELIDVKGNEIFIKLGGGCQGCAMARLTLKNGIEKGIRESVPAAGAIHDTTDHEIGENPYHK